MCKLLAILFSGNFSKCQRPRTTSDGVSRPARNYRGMLNILWFIAHYSLPDDRLNSHHLSGHLIMY